MTHIHGIPSRIVGETSKTWIQGQDLSTHKKFLSQQFEKIISVNADRGYELESWEMTSTHFISRDAPAITETIIAVFEWAGPSD